MPALCVCQCLYLSGSARLRPRRRLWLCSGPTAMRAWRAVHQTLLDDLGDVGVAQLRALEPRLPRNRPAARHLAHRVAKSAALLDGLVHPPRRVVREGRQRVAKRRVADGPEESLGSTLPREAASLLRCERRGRRRERVAQLQQELGGGVVEERIAKGREEGVAGMALEDDFFLHTNVWYSHQPRPRQRTRYECGTGLANIPEDVFFVASSSHSGELRGRPPPRSQGWRRRRRCGRATCQQAAT